MDMISKLPTSILETILCLLPIQEAVRTSILSKDWRYRWIKIPKLVFNVDTFQVSSTDASGLSVSEQTFDSPRQRKNINKRLFVAIFQVLVMHEGPLLEFTLSMYTDDPCAVEIECIIILLARKNTLKKLSLEITWDYKLPFAIFSLRQLTDLYLIGCDFDHQPPFNGFDSLTTLSVKEVCTSKITLLHLLSSCPLLTSLEIAGTTFESSDDYTIINLFESLPKIENLIIAFYTIKCFVEDEVPNVLSTIPKVLPTELVHLNYLFIEDISFIQRFGLPILFLLIKSSPNLEKLEIQIIDDSWIEEYERSDSLTFEDYSDIWLEYLNELEIINVVNRKTELDFVKLILAKSPMLKKVKIFLCNEIAKDEEMEISQILQGSLHISPVVEIKVEICGDSCTNNSRSVM